MTLDSIAEFVAQFPELKLVRRRNKHYHDITDYSVVIKELPEVTVFSYDDRDQDGPDGIYLNEEFRMTLDSDGDFREDDSDCGAVHIGEWFTSLESMRVPLLRVITFLNQLAIARKQIRLFNKKLKHDLAAYGYDAVLSSVFGPESVDIAKQD